MALTIKRTEEFAAGFRAIRSPKVRAAILKRIERLAAGNPGDVEPIGQGVSEMRLHLEQGWRVYYKQQGDTLVVLLCVGSKGSQTKDIKIAKQIAATLV